MISSAVLTISKTPTGRVTGAPSYLLARMKLCKSCIYACMYVAVHAYLHNCILMMQIHQHGIKTPPSWDPKSSKLGSKIHQVGVQNPSTWGPKTRKIRPWKGLGAVWGPSWFQDKAKCQKVPRRTPLDLHRTSQVGPKNNEKSILIPFARWSFFGLFFGTMLSTIWNQLGRILAPKTFPKSSQDGPEIDPKWNMILRVVFWGMLTWFLLIFVTNITWPT